MANPNGSYSSHSRGNTVDLTLVDAEGQELTMPTGFDDFSKKANRNYSDVSREAADNARLLEKIMLDCGFTSIHSEWWHFVDSKSYSPEKAFRPIAKTLYTGTGPVLLLDSRGWILACIPFGESFSVIALDEDLLLAEYRGVTGYVQASAAVPAV